MTTALATCRARGVHPDLVDAVLEEAARFCQDVLLPINRSGDEEGCR
jgi:hypothetical protein